MSSACQCHIEGAFCFYCEVYSPVVAENERLRELVKKAVEDAEASEVSVESFAAEAHNRDMLTLAELIAGGYMPDWWYEAKRMLSANEDDTFTEVKPDDDGEEGQLKLYA